jgi:hypothetical protein
MTDQLHPTSLDAKGVATTLSRHGPLAGMRARSRARGFEPQSPLTVALTVIRRAVAAGANACFSRFLASLHETRRQQAAVERARYRHLIYDADTGISFAADATAQAPRPEGSERAGARAHRSIRSIEAVRHPPARARG